LTWDTGSVAYDVDACVACGVCVTTCPTGATVNPTVTEHQIAAQIKAMVDASMDPVGIEFRCRGARPQPLADGWFPVEVPCTGMLTIGWLLAPLVLGAGSVAAPTCSESGCGLGNDEVLAARRIEAGSLLDALGLAAGSVGDRAGGRVPESIASDTTCTLDGFRDADVYLALADLTHTSDTRFSSSTASIGVVTLDESTCTVCEQCTSVCPPRALKSQRSGSTVEISFDPFACVGCAMCVATCPEIERGAITLERRFDASELTLGSRVILSGSTSTCEVCGGPIAPSAMLDRIQSMLGPDHAGTLDLISRRCLNCR
jgi:Pyruvate/2-oxoacid:ferredoxin oxidoreductase delta subunit